MIKIVWLTAGCFLDSEIPVLATLNKRFDIKWIVAEKEGSFTAQHAQEYAEKNGIDLQFFYMKRKWYHPLSYLETAQLMKFVSGIEGDVYYLDYTTFPHLFVSMGKYMHGKKVLLAMHHGKAHEGVRFHRLHNIYLKWLRNQNYFFKFFSLTQSNLFHSDPSRKFVIQLPVNNAFGSSSKQPSNDKVVFQYFGHMISTKNVGLLIKAACKLKEQTDKPFVVRVYGHCRNWEQLYQPLVKYPEIFDLRPESIPDEEIPDVFSSAHYLVQPYKTVTQSGPTKLAYGYHLPIIASDLPGFRESIIEHVTGLFFKANNEEALVATMKSCLDNHPRQYVELREKQTRYVDENLSVERVIDQYAKMFERIDMMTESEYRQIRAEGLMTRVVNHLKELHLLLFLKMLPDMLKEYWNFSGMTVRCGLSERRSNQQTEMMMLTHSIEKAFSLSNIRSDFGLAKMKSLYSMVYKYSKQYGYDETLHVPISLMYAYQDFRKKHNNLPEEISQMMERIGMFIENMGMKPSQFCEAGALHVTRQEMLSLQEIDFGRLASQRYSFRNFNKRGG